VLEVACQIGMRTESLPYRYTDHELAFYIVATDRDMLSQVNRLMSRSGYVGLMDTAGRLHYIVDGRRGVPYASMRILEATGRILCDREQKAQPLLQSINRTVDAVLASHGIRPELKGYQYLRCMLVLVGFDDTKLKPVSKTLYPMVSEHFHVTVSQVERDIRYALRETDFHKNGLTPSAAICRLHQELVQKAEEALMSENKKPRGPAYRPKGFLK
jgi:hypothetical protein